MIQQAHEYEHFKKLKVCDTRKKHFSDKRNKNVGKYTKWNITRLKKSKWKKENMK